MTAQISDAPVAVVGRVLTNGVVTDPNVPGAGDDLCCAREVRILIVDDDEATGKVIEMALQGHEFAIRRVSDTAEVRAALQTSPADSYHLIMLDYVLPGLESNQVFAWIHEFQPEASVIVVTGYPSIDSALTCLRARTYDYITKPFQLSHLRQVVLSCLASKGLLRMTEDTLRESLGTAIRERRKSLGLTLAQMATKTDVSLGYLSQIELGKNSASIETLYRICLALGIKMADLFTSVQRAN